MINTAVLMGRLTYQPEMKETTSGIAVCKFQLAVDRRYVPKGQDKETDFIDCVAFRQTAEFIGKYFDKGNLIAIEGSIQTENFTDKAGNKRKSTTVVANHASFSGEKRETAQPSADRYDEYIIDDDPLFTL